MMVVIGIIAILGAVVVPGFKKIYSDFKIMETRHMLDSILSAMRSFYLIRSEQTWTVSHSTIEDRLLPFLSGEWLEVKSHFYKILDYKYHHPALYDTKPVKRFYLIPDNFDPHYSTDGHGFKFRFYYSPAAGRPYYLNDLLEEYRKKGYTIKEPAGSNEVNLYFPERPNDIDTDYSGRYFR